MAKRSDHGNRIHDDHHDHGDHDHHSPLEGNAPRQRDHARGAGGHASAVERSPPLATLRHPPPPDAPERTAFDYACADHGPERAVRVNVPLLLPGLDQDCERCAEEVTRRLVSQRGVHDVHVERDDGRATLCLHYDPNLLTLAKALRVAEGAGAETSRRYRHEELWVTGMDCPDCAISVEHVLRRQAGVLDARANYAAEKVRIEYDTKAMAPAELRKRIRSLGYGVEEDDGHGHGPGEADHHAGSGLAWPLVSGAALAAGWLGESFLGLPPSAALALYVIAYVAGGWDVTRHGIQAALRGRFHIEFLMVVAALGAAALGEWPEGALLLFLFGLGHALEQRATDKARRAIAALGALTPRTARVRRDGAEAEVPVGQLLRGDVVVVRPGERVPVDGDVVAGRSAVDQSPVTGESVPVEKEPGKGVFAGTVNGEGALEVAVTRLAKDSTLARVVQMVAEAQTQKSPSQRFAERFERVFVPVVLAVSVAVVVVPSAAAALAPDVPLLGAIALPWQEALLRGLTLLVAASPCALGISTPAAVLSGVARAARVGVLFKGGAHLENLGAVQVVAFDKTGTLTVGRPEVTDVVPLDGRTAGDVLRIAASVESRSGHPLAKAVVRKASDDGLALLASGDLRSVPGLGVEGSVEGKPVRLGSLRMFLQPPDEVVALVHKLEASGRTTMVVEQGGRYIGVVALADRPRPEAAMTLRRLRSLGIQQLVMITGDNERSARAIARAVGFSDVRAGLLPEQKVDAVKDLAARHGAVAMVGDGVNDAPAMAHASVGVAMGASGTDVALETADVALMSDRLDRLPEAFAISRATRRVIRQNLAVSLGVIALLVPSAALGVAGIGEAIVLHEGSTLLVVGNALRLLRFNGAR